MADSVVALYLVHAMTFFVRRLFGEMEGSARQPHRAEGVRLLSRSWALLATDLRNHDVHVCDFDYISQRSSRTFTDTSNLNYKMHSSYRICVATTTHS